MASGNRSHGNERRGVHGVLLLDKPAGISSNHAVQAAKRLYAAERVGHTGTLDPLATGLLVLALGEATKFTTALLASDKCYDATLGLGATTSTGDAEGEVLARSEVTVTRPDLERVLREFIGEIDQVPPMHSALKKDGRPLYAYARAGVTVARPPRRVVVHALDLVACDGDEVRLRVRVGKGTYVRTLAEDIGRRLGCGAHLAALRRTHVGRFRLADAVTLAALERASAAERDGLLRPVDAMLADLPEATLGPEAAGRFVHGQEVEAAGDSGAVRVYGPEGAFLGLGQRTEGRLRPERLVAAAAGARLVERREPRVK
ncbi:MAG: tRNA pseudouridine(55) synthase TruB [Burkholderiales bacterium]|nr:tRNA pseudouridine(55) synthase TruB [Burkholderiales bacterium]